MKVLVIGSGGREHALTWAIRRSPRVSEVVCTPGNGGICARPDGSAGAEVRCVPVNGADLGDLLRVVAEEKPDLTVVGPELPLSLGLVDELRRRSLCVFGPTQAAAMLETSKAFAKRFMQRHNIPTAAYAICTTPEQALESLGLFHTPVVIKADGLAAGKGVLICDTKAQAIEAIVGLFGGKLLGNMERTIVIEEFLNGEELSLLCLTDGRHVVPLAPAQDHKRIGEGDTGPNTGGMGVYSTDEMLDPTMRDWLIHHVAQPTIDGMAAEETPFTGVLYVGLMMTARGPMVLEYNARFGDPEAQAILMRLKSDLVEGLEACVEGRLSDTEFRWRDGASACVVASSGGYPGSFSTGQRITGLRAAAEIEGVQVFHAGTALVDGEFVTAGGRVLGVAAAADSLAEALGLAYQGMEKIQFDAMYYRRDIGQRALRRK
ncbi:MAG TPA: phosphoribosylamine--glycine ligase [Acidisarcina sp.]